MTYFLLAFKSLKFDHLYCVPRIKPDLPCDSTVPEKSLMKAKGRSTVFKEWNFHLCKWAELQRNVAADLELNNTRLLQCAKFPKHLDFPRSAASEIVLPIFSFASLKYNK